MPTFGLRFSPMTITPYRYNSEPDRHADAASKGSQTEECS